MKKILVDKSKRCRNEVRQKPPEGQRMVDAANGRRAFVWIKTAGPPPFRYRSPSAAPAPRPAP